MSTEPETPLPSLEAFEQKLEKARQSEDTQAVPAAGMAMRLGAEFSAGVLVGVGIGLLLDNWLGTRPWMLMLCMCFGAAAGVKTMMATLKNIEKQNTN